MADDKRIGELEALMRRQMNGAVVDSMRAHGIVYPSSYGVSVHTIREIAAPYAPDHELAKLLYAGQLREHKLAAVIIADPDAVTRDELDFWAARIVNTEVAEHLASSLLGKSRIVNAIINRWTQSGEPLVLYAGLLTAVKGIDVAKDCAERNWEPVLAAVMQSAGASQQRYVWRGLALLLERIANHVPDGVAIVVKFLGDADAAGFPGIAYLREELGWLLPEK